MVWICVISVNCRHRSLATDPGHVTCWDDTAASAHGCWWWQRIRWNWCCNVRGDYYGACVGGDYYGAWWLLWWLVSSVAGVLVHPRYSPVTMTSSLVFVGPGPVHVSLGLEFFNFNINIQWCTKYYKTHSKSLECHHVSRRQLVNKVEACIIVTVCKNLLKWSFIIVSY